MTEAQMVELARAIRKALPPEVSLTWDQITEIAIGIGLRDTKWQDPLACSL